MWASPTTQVSGGRADCVLGWTAATWRSSRSLRAAGHPSTAPDTSVRTALRRLRSGVTWRYFGEAKNELVNPGFPSSYSAANIALGRPDARIPTVSYIDLRASYTWEKYTVRVGCNNVADKDPPLFDTITSGGNSTFAESNTFPSMYDTAGRYLYLNVTADF